MGVGEKTPTPPGPPCTEVAALGAFETAPGELAVVDPVDNSVVDPPDEALLEEVPVVPLPLVEETASCAFANSDNAAIDMSVAMAMDERLISWRARCEPRLEQVTSNRFVMILLHNSVWRFIVFHSAPRFAFPRSGAGFAIG